MSTVLIPNSNTISLVIGASARSCKMPRNGAMPEPVAIISNGVVPSLSSNVESLINPQKVGSDPVFSASARIPEIIPRRSTVFDSEITSSIYCGFTFEDDAIV